MNIPKNQLLLIYEKIADEIGDKIYIDKDIGKHNINLDQAYNFIEKLCFPKAIQLAEFILNNTQYIDFDTFLNKVKMLVRELVIFKKEYNAKLILIVNNYNIYKSNFWMSLLFRKELLKYNINYDDIMSDIKFDLSEYLNKTNDNYIFLITDDCSYSGKQLSGDLLLKKRISEKLTAELYKRFKVFLGVPYISNFAKKIKFMENFKGINTEYIYFPKNTTYFQNFWEIAYEKQFNPFDNDILYKDESDIEKNTHSLLFDFFGIYGPTSLIYFDHKLADRVSIAQCVYNYGMIFNKFKVLNLDELSDTLDGYKNNIKYIISEFLTEGKTLQDIIMDTEYYSRSYKAKDELYNATLPEMETYGLNLFKIKEDCYVHKIKSEYIQNVDYYPLTECENNNREYIGCSTDLNDQVQVCPETYYKTLDYTYNGKNIKSMFKQRDDATLDNIIKLLENQVGGYKKYMKYKYKYLLLKSLNN